MPTTTPVSKRLQKSATKSKVGPDQWSEWTQHLATRKRPRALRSLIDTGRTSALEWPLHADFPGSESAELLRYLDRFKSAKTRGNGELARRLEAWLDEAPQRAPTALFAIECLGWAHTMPQLAQLLPAAPWCQLQDQLVSICDEAAGICLTDNPLAQQLLYGELPLTLAYLFPEVDQCELLAETARRALSDGILELLDGEGLINSRFHDTMRPLFASWTRCGCLARSSRQPCFEKVAQDQYNWLVRESLRLARHDGSQVLTHDDSGRWSPTLFETALKLISRRVDTAIALEALPGGKKAAAESGKAKSSPKLPEAAVHSEWAGTALLKRSWSRDDESLVLAYHDQELAVELNCGSAMLWSGKWDFEIAVDGEQLAVTDLWEEVCWVCDGDVSYVEVEAKLSNGWRLQRQLLLGRDERFLFIADAVLGNRSGHIEYKSSLPLVDGIKFQPANETCEGRLKGRRHLATVLPLALPEWRLPAHGGSLEQTDKGLVLSQQVDGFRLFAPLFVDLNPLRSKKPLTWRQLTVAQQLEIVSADEAVGYRVQIGNEQWLFYRSLGPTGNRTLLGQNYSGEFIAARFPGGGEAEKLIEIE
jgi:hypothetical protein